MGAGSVVTSEPWCTDSVAKFTKFTRLASVFILAIISSFPEGLLSSPLAKVGKHNPFANGEKTSSIFYLSKDNSDQETIRETIRNYTREMFSPIRPQTLNIPVALIVDNSSFLLDLPIYAQLKSEVAHFDIVKEMRESEGELFSALYVHESQIEKKERDARELRINSRDVAAPPQVSQNRLELMLNNVFTVPRTFRPSANGENGRFREAVGDYISRKFAAMGLVTGLHQFRPTQFIDAFYQGLDKLPRGSNIFGLYPGRHWGTSLDQPLILGAHWDTVETSDGYNDNGSGVAAILEIARVMTQHFCQPEHSVFFVAFDMEEVGGQGSLEFVHRYLVPHVLKKYGLQGIKGAVVIDTILNYDEEEGSQDMGEEEQRLVPATARVLRDNGFRGNYLNVIKRTGSDEQLYRTLRRLWHKEGNTSSPRQFGLLASDVPLGRDEEGDEWEDFVQFLRSDHARFWLANDSDYRTLDAILLTDTGPARGRMRECYHQSCDSVRRRSGPNSPPPAGADFADLEFYVHTVQTLLETALEISEAKCRGDDIASSQSGMEMKNDVDKFSGTAATISQTWGMMPMIVCLALLSNKGRL